MGLARVRPLHEHDRLHSSMTREGTVVGTLDYMAPEQAKSASKVDGRADLYGLGCTLFHLLTGRPPFTQGSGMEKLLRHQLDPPPTLRSLLPEAPAALEAVVARLLEKRPEDRFATAAEVAAALEPFCDPDRLRTAAPAPAPPLAIPVAGPAVVAVGLSAETPAAPPRSPSPGRLRRPRRQQAMWLALGLAVVSALILVGVGAAMLTRPGPAASTTAAAGPPTPAPTPKEKPEPSYARFITDDVALLVTADTRQMWRGPLGEKVFLPDFQDSLRQSPAVRRALQALNLDPVRAVDRVTVLSSAGDADRSLVVIQGQFASVKWPQQDTPVFKQRPVKGLAAGKAYRLVDDAGGPDLNLAVLGTDTVLAAADANLLGEALAENRGKAAAVRDLLKELSGKEMIGVVGLGRALVKAGGLERLDAERLLADRTTVRGQVLADSAALTAEFVFHCRQEQGAERLKPMLEGGLRPSLLLALPVSTERKDLQALRLLLRNGTFATEARSVVFRSRVTLDMITR